MPDVRLHDSRAPNRPTVTSCLPRQAACTDSKQCCSRMCANLPGGGRCGPVDNEPKPPSATESGTFSCSGTIDINGEDCAKELGTDTTCLKSDGGIWCPAIRSGCTCTCSVGDCPNAGGPSREASAPKHPDVTIAIVGFEKATFANTETTGIRVQITNIGNELSRCVLNVSARVDGIESQRAGSWSYDKLLAAGASANGELRTMPRSWGPGRHSVTVKIDQTGCSGDINSSNDTSAPATFTVTQAPNAPRRPR